MLGRMIDFPDSSCKASFLSKYERESVKVVKGSTSVVLQTGQQEEKVSHS